MSSPVPHVFESPPVCKPGTYLAFDLETDLITPENPTPNIVSCQVSIEGDSTVYGGDEESLAEGLQTVLNALEEGWTIIAHNGFFDWACILNLLDWPLDLQKRVFEGFLSGQLRDTSIRARLHSIEGGQTDASISLAACVERYLGETVEGKYGEDVWRLRYSELRGIPAKDWPLAAYQYARLDPIYVERVYDAMAVAAGHYHDEVFQTTKAWALYLAGVWGIRVDPEKREKLAEEIQPTIDESMEQLFALGVYERPYMKLNKEAFGEWLDTCMGGNLTRTSSGKVSLSASTLKKAAPVVGEWVLDKDKWLERAPEESLEEVPAKKNTARLADIVVDHFREVVGRDPDPGMDPELFTATGRVKTDREVVSGVPVLKPLVDMGEVDTLRKTFIPAMRRSSTNILHPRHDPLKATGRNSASNPNLNNQPKYPGVRECFVAREGWVMCAADYAQAELCSLAQVCIDLFGRSVMAEKINAGVDLHSYLASVLFEEDYDAFVARLKAGDPAAKKARQHMKAPNFGLPGGMGDQTFMVNAERNYGIEGLTLDTVKQWREGWMRAWPEVGPYLQRVGTLCRNGGTFTVEQHRSGRRRGGCGYSDGANSYFQGMTADGAGLAVIQFQYEAHCDPTSPLFGGRLLAFVYDELLCEWPDRGPEANTRAVERLCEVMKSSMEVLTPDVRATVEPALMYAWSKKAEEVRDADGYIIPWVPEPDADIRAVGR